LALVTGVWSAGWVAVRRLVARRAVRLISVMKGELPEPANKRRPEQGQWGAQVKGRPSRIWASSPC
jgi:hypothetical protein